jgi:alkanesulfonate monooxygenase SsuD/methylene tetrahydromethanopterin reductase-like flavin-dependent oxidoreductase (luciferase family)
MLRVGNYLHVAIRAAGIARQTFDGWMTRGLSGLEADEPYRRLRDRVEQARAEGQARHVALVARAATDDWRAAAWLLERQYPAMWGAVSVRVRAEEPEPQELPTAASDPFAEVDELAERRRGR